MNVELAEWVKMKYLKYKIHCEMRRATEAMVGKSVMFVCGNMTRQQKGTITGSCPSGLRVKVRNEKTGKTLWVSPSYIVFEDGNT